MLQVFRETWTGTTVTQSLLGFINGPCKCLFEYTLKFRNITAHANVDTLSRLPLPVEPAISQFPSELVLPI